MVLPLAGAIAEVVLSAAETLAQSLAGRAVNAVLEGGKVTVQLSSSAIASASYEPDTSLMQITFTSGNTYDFPGTDQQTFEGLVTAPSPGSYYNEHIKGTSHQISRLTSGLTHHWGAR